VPKPFTQAMIIMMYEEASHLYIPVFYVLLQSKLEEVYKIALSHCFTAADYKIKAISVTCDYEKALINAIKCLFPEEVPVVGCEFHWKQALRRKMIDLHIPRQLISKLVNKDGLINILSHIPETEIISKGIPFIRHYFDEGEYTSHFNIFWKYFEKTWMGTYDEWNIYLHIRNKKQGKSTLMNRTNNPLERFNRTLKETFIHHGAFPSLANFVNNIKELSCTYVTKYENIMNKYMSAPCREEEPHLFIIPKEYESFTGNTASNETTRKKRKNMSSIDSSSQRSTRREEYVSDDDELRPLNINKFKHVIGKIHYDEEFKMHFEVVRLSIREFEDGDVHIMGHRLEHPLPDFPQHGAELVDDVISLAEILDMAHLPYNMIDVSRVCQTQI
jgi:hypothetical protein